MRGFIKQEPLALGAVLAISALVSLLTLGTHALFTASEANSGNDVSTDELTAASLNVPSATGGNVSLDWDPASLRNDANEDEITYSVERQLGSGSFEAASTDCTDTSDTDCEDTVTQSGSYTYRVIAKFRSWTAESNTRTIAVTVGGNTPDAPDEVRLANGTGVGNAYISEANESSVSVEVDLPASSTAGDTVHVDITDGTNTTAEETATAAGGVETVTVNGIDASGLDDGTVTIRGGLQTATAPRATRPLTSRRTRSSPSRRPARRSSRTARRSR